MTRGRRFEWGLGLVMLAFLGAACAASGERRTDTSGSSPPVVQDAAQDATQDSTQDAAEEGVAVQTGDEALEGASLDAGEPSDVGAPGDGSEDASSWDAATDAVVDARSLEAEAGVGAEAETSAACHPTVDSPPLLPAVHVAIGSDIQWDSNPPSSGPHYPVWAAYQAYDTPVPRGYYVHDLEHGAIVFAFNCGDGGCPDVVAAFHAAADSLPDDPLCTAAGEGIRVRFVITPDPLLDVPIAAAAWGWTYKADCVDLPSLEAFAAAHYGQGPEDFCTNGTTQF